MEQEKKVEYVELIYDLIFVYLIGRNNTLLHVIKDGFIDPSSFLTYVLAALIVLQIWYNSTLFVNRYGKNDRSMHVYLFVNMYLLYFMAKGIRADWQEAYYTFNSAWALTLVNTAVQYWLQLRKDGGRDPWGDARTKLTIQTMFIQVAVILASFPVFHYTGIPLSPIAMALGYAFAMAVGSINLLVPVEFGHLSERVMLYVVFTFGEMIIALSAYFEGGAGAQTIYYSALGFLIVAGLFVSYGYAYDHLIDRKKNTNGTGFMMLHILLILSLNHITAALEFMPEPGIDSFAKNAFLVLSFIVYFATLYGVMRYNKPHLLLTRRMKLQLACETAAFAGLILLTYRNGMVSIAITAAYIWLVFFSLRSFRRARTVS